MGSRASYVALLRGINVGGKNKLPMTDLSAMFSAAGGAAVRTYIQSGNVVFEASTAAAGALPGKVERAIEAGFGYRVPVILRSAEDLGAVLRENPFLAGGADPGVLHVAFLSAEPLPARVAALDPARSPPDDFLVRGREIYLRCPNGYGNTKLTNAYFDAKLGATSTVRNWRTVEKLVDMAKG
jgi:uncharacterized protein (DUF1697 family)